MGTAPPARISPGWVGRRVGRAIHRRLAALACTTSVIVSTGARARLEPWLRDPGSGPIFVYYWIEDALPLMLYACRADTAVDESWRFVCDDTVAGRITAELLSRLGYDDLPLRLASDATRVRDVQRLIVERGTIGIAVDGRGPYRTVGREFARLALRRGAAAIPLAARVDRAWRLRLGGPLTVPRKRSRLAIEVGEAIAPEGGSADLTRRLQDALDSAGEGAQRLLASAQELPPRYERRR